MRKRLYALVPSAVMDVHKTEGGKEPTESRKMLEEEEIIESKDTIRRERETKLIRVHIKSKIISSELEFDMNS